MNEDRKAFEKIKARRLSSKRMWKIFFFFMIILFIEVPLPPLPPQMAFPLALFAMFLTGGAFYRATRLPVREALLLARSNRGQLSLSLVYRFRVRYPHC